MKLQFTKKKPKVFKGLRLLLITKKLVLDEKKITNLESFIFPIDFHHRIWEQIYNRGEKKENRKEKCRDLNTGPHFGHHKKYFTNYFVEV